MIEFAKTVLKYFLRSQEITLYGRPLDRAQNGFGTLFLNMSGRSINRSQWQIAIISLIVCSGLLVAAIHTGLERDLDGRIGYGLGAHLFPMAAAISDLSYDLNAGFLSYRDINNTLYSKINAETMGNRDFINGLLQEVSRARVMPDFNFQQGSVGPAVGDLGMVEWYKLGFRLFGMNVESSFWLYYLFFAVSALTYWVGLIRIRPAHAVLILAVAGHLFFVHSDLLSGTQLFTVTNNRALAVLAIVPALHISIALLFKQWPDPPAIFMLLLQALFLSFVISMRPSAMWVLVMVLGVVCFQSLLKIMRFKEHRSLSSVVAPVVFWPVLIVLAGHLVVTGYFNAEKHWLYKVQIYQNGHLTWHNAYMSLKMRPDFQNYFPEKLHSYNGDSFSVHGSAALLEEVGIPSDYLTESLTGDHTWVLHDRIMKHEFLSFIAENPIYFAELILIEKTRTLLVTVGGYWQTVSLAVVDWFLLFFAALFAGYILWRSKEGGSRRAIIAVGAALGASTAPAYWAYAAAHVSSDIFIISVIFVFLTCLTGIVYLAQKRIDSVASLSSGIPKKP